MHISKQFTLPFKKSLFIGLSALSLIACGGGGSGDGDSGSGDENKLNLSLIISGGIKTNGLMLKNTASGADNTPFAVAKTAASTLNISGKIAKDSNYDIKVAHQPDGFGQHCHVEQGTGTSSNTEISIQLKCVDAKVAVWSYAGKKYTADKTNSNDRFNARFNYPNHMVFDSKGNLFIADSYNHQIRKITPAGQVSTFAGSGTIGAVNGTGSAASFKYPANITVDKNDNLYVGGDECVRKITPNAVVTTLAGKCGEKGRVPSGYTTTSTGTDARFNTVGSMVYDGDNALYMVDGLNYVIRKITLNAGTASTVVVKTIVASGTSNISMQLSADKKSLYYIRGVDYNLYQVDLANTNQPKTATRLTTTARLKGFKNGSFSVAQFDIASNQMIVSKSGQFLYLAEHHNNRIRRIDLDNKEVTTLAGEGTRSVLDGVGIRAKFRNPRGIAQDAQGNIFVSSYGHVIRKLVVIKP